MTPAEWCETLNRRVFFWMTERRLHRLLNGQLYRESDHDVLTVDTAQLLKRHRERVTLAPYNTGATVQTAPERGSNTFKCIEDYDFDYWRRKRSRQDAIVELAVDYAVPDIAELVVRVERRRGAQILKVLWVK